MLSKYLRLLPNSSSEQAKHSQKMLFFIIKHCSTEKKMSLETLVLVIYSRENSFSVQHIVSSLFPGERRKLA